MRFVYVTAAMCFVASHATSSAFADPATVFQPTVLTQPAAEDGRYVHTYSLIDIADIDGDGYLDTLQFEDYGPGCLRYCYPPPPSLRWSKNSRTKTVFGEEYVSGDNVEQFNVIRFQSNGFDANGTFDTAQLADVDGDGDLDLVADLYRWVHPEDPTPYPPDHRLSVFLNTGSDAVFADETRLLGVGGLNDAEYLRFGAKKVLDVDADGGQDLLVAVRDEGVFWYRNLGGGGAFGPFSEPSLLDSHHGAIATTDIDGDGDTDFFVSNPGQPTYLYQNDRGGRFTVKTIGSGQSIISLSFADLNGDGLTDLLGYESEALGPRVSAFKYFLNAGASDLFSNTNGSLLGAPNTQCTGTVADINADSRPDIAQSCRNEETVVYMNTGDRVDPFPVDGQQVSVAGAPFFSAAGDFNNDGYDDFIRLGYGAQEIYLNNQFAGLPMPVIDISYPSNVFESSGYVDIEFSLSSPQTKPVSVQFGTVADTAKPREDFYGVFRNVEFAPGDTLKTVRIGLVDDDVAEPDKRLFGRAAFSRGANISTLVININIQEDPSDVAGALRIADGYGSESAGFIEIPITLERALAVPVTFTVATQRRDRAGFATEGEDYRAKVERLTIPAGQTKAVFTVEILDDGENETQERFLVRLYGATNAEIEKAWSLGVINY